MPLTVAEEGLNGCSGCEMAILDMGEGLLDLLPELTFIHFPLLMDFRYRDRSCEGSHGNVPAADLGILTGGIRNDEHLAVAGAMRRNCRILMALGTCATHGGIPALINPFGNEELLDRLYRTMEGTDAGETPAEGVPVLLDRTYALDEKVCVNVYLPGCPPHPSSIAAALRAILKGDAPDVTAKSVCEWCPTQREGKSISKQVRRFTLNAQYRPEAPLSEMRCLLEQGLMCMGPVTKGGCGGTAGGAPRCIVARVPCRGCYGPVKHQGNQMLDMLNVLASNGTDIRSIPDRLSLLRFSGAHGRLGKKHKKS